jgi:transposase
MPGIALREDYDVAGLRKHARRASGPRQVRRLLALAAVYEGRSRAEAASIGGMDRQTLRDWALRFNADGPDGLLNRKSTGQPRLLTPDQMQALAELVEIGPDRAVHGVVRWRRIDLQRVLKERFDVKVSLGSLSRLLDELAFSHITGRPQHPQQDPTVIEAFKKTSRARLRRI